MQILVGVMLLVISTWSFVWRSIEVKMIYQSISDPGLNGLVFIDWLVAAVFWSVSWWILISGYKNRRG